MPFDLEFVRQNWPQPVFYFATIDSTMLEAARLAEAGLMRLYDTLEAHVRKLREQHANLEIAFNATGGFKAETAILYGLGLELGIPVYYLHETYKVPIVLPICAAPF